MNDILLFYIPCEYQYVPKTQLEFSFTTCISFYLFILCVDVEYGVLTVVSRRVWFCQIRVAAVGNSAIL